MDKQISDLVEAAQELMEGLGTRHGESAMFVSKYSMAILSAFRLGKIAARYGSPKDDERAAAVMEALTGMYTGMLDQLATRESLSEDAVSDIITLHKNIQRRVTAHEKNR